MLTRKPARVQTASCATRIRSPRIRWNSAEWCRPNASVPLFVMATRRARARSAQRHRQLDFAKWPKGDRGAKQDGDADVYSEAKGQFVVAAGLEHREGAFETVARFDVLSGELAGHPADAIGDAGFGESGLDRTSSRNA